MKTNTHFRFGDRVDITRSMLPAQRAHARFLRYLISANSPELRKVDLNLMQITNMLDSERRYSKELDAGVEIPILPRPPMNVRRNIKRYDILERQDECPLFKVKLLYCNGTVVEPVEIEVVHQVVC